MLLFLVMKDRAIAWFGPQEGPPVDEPVEVYILDLGFMAIESTTATRCSVLTSS
jgi:hypothetical protein